MTSFNGRFEAKVDSKGRLLLPKGLLAQFPCDDSGMVMTNSQYRGSRTLDVYTRAEWKKLEKRISKLSPLKAEVQDFRRFYMASGADVEPDANNRILIPSLLRKFSQISSEIVIVGMGSKFEIWAAEVWQRMFEQLSDGFEETLACVAELDQGLESGGDDDD